MSGDLFHRIRHGGASALAPANTLESFDAAVAVGIDMIEFDVRECRGELVLAHTLFDARRSGVVRLDHALAHLAGRRFAEVGLNLDVKQVGCEPALLHGLRSTGLLDRALLSSQVPVVLDRLRELEPRVRIGISIGGRAARLSRRPADPRLFNPGMPRAGNGGLPAQPVIPRHPSRCLRDHRSTPALASDRSLQR